MFRKDKIYDRVNKKNFRKREDKHFLCPRCFRDVETTQSKCIICGYIICKIEDCPTKEDFLPESHNAI